MKHPPQREIVRALFDRHGQTFCEEIGINIERETPSALFQWLCASILFSARISGAIAVEAARALAKQGWTTAEKMAHSTWAQRAKTLNESGYARYDERTSSMLGDTAAKLLDEYQGDLRKLREKAGRSPEEERTLLQEFKGLGESGVDIFFREVQTVWQEIAPFVDQKSMRAAEKLGLPHDPDQLARLVARKDLPRLLTALVRCDLERDHDAVLEQVRGGRKAA